MVKASISDETRMGYGSLKGIDVKLVGKKGRR